MTRRDPAVRGLRREPAVAALRLAAVLVAIAALAACGGTGQAATTRYQAAASSNAAVTSDAGPAQETSAVPGAGVPHAARPGGPPLVPAPPAPSALPVAPGAGSLPQTTALPGTASTAFRNAMDDLWLAVTTGDASLARPAFFPETAYVQVKAIADPQADWEDRLWYDFTLDVAAAHALVGRGATFLRVDTQPDYAAWVSEGACYNKAGYWHLPGPRVVYEAGGETRSFGIASLISWRGDWYVVHFGAVTRAGAYGEVDDPQAGPGTPGPSGGC